MALPIDAEAAGHDRRGPTRRQRQRRSQLQAVRDSLLADNAELAERTQRLQSDDAYLQRLIRRELGYARPNELIYRFPYADTANNQ